MRTMTMAAMAGFIALTGCAAPGAQREDPAPCRDIVVTVQHRAQGSTRKSAYITARPELAQVCRGSNLTIQFRPPVAANGATSDGPAGAGWLSGTSPGGDRILLQVPPDADLGTFKYTIRVQGVGFLDPRATVVR